MSKRVWETFKSFWMAEEVPRWFGLSLVVVYLLGLGAVAYTGINAVRREAEQHLERNDRFALSLLAERLAAHAAAHSTPETAKPPFQRELFEFAAHYPCRHLRVIRRDGFVVASIQLAEVGKTPAASDHPPPRSLEYGQVRQPAGYQADRRIRVPLAASETPVTTAVAGPNAAWKGDAAEPDAVPAESFAASLYVDAQLPSPFLYTSTLAGQADSAVIVLVALGVLFVLYRRLRSQLRGTVRIAGRLGAHRDRIRDSLATLRLMDADDAISAAWNELVDLAQELSEAVNRRSAQEELAQALQRASGGALAEALNAVPDGMLYVTDEVNVAFANATACHLMGWKPGDSRRTLSDGAVAGAGARILEVIKAAHLPDGNYEVRSEIIETGAAEDLAAGDSSLRVWIIPLHRAHRNGECMVVIRDVSQQIRAEKSREDFVTQVTHELRTPLTNIRAYAETLSSGMFEDPKVVTECYNVITKETRRLSRLIEDILSVSQLEVGSIDLHLDQVNLKTLLSEAVRDIRGLADEKNIDVQQVLPPKMDPIRADRDKLAVVVNNLLGNAIKYTPRDGNVVVGCQYTPDAVVITFKDNGIGIDPADQARVFEKFARASDPAVQAETGTGIGLYTAREIVRRHGGDIELISEKGVGSTFMVRLPHRESRTAATPPVPGLHGAMQEV